MKPKAARPPAKGDRPVLLPGATLAEPWEVWLLRAAGGVECLQTCARPVDNKWRKNSVLALPVSEVFCVPLWLNEADEKQFAGMIPLQLELRGFHPRGNSSLVFDWSVVAQEEKRTLVIVGILPATLASDVTVDNYNSFDLSARYFTFPENALTLWRERDQIVMAVTRGAKLVYFQALGTGSITPPVLQDLNCIQTTLTMQGVMSPAQQIVLWLEVSPSELTLLQSGLHLPLRQVEQSAPKAPALAWKLTPPVVSEGKRARERRGWWMRGIVIAAALYFLFAGWLVTRLFMTSLKVEELRHWQADHAQAIALVHDTAATWKELGPAVDENSYPLELLLHVTESIPADQLHLTLFEAGSGHLLIKGEAKNVAAAFQFLDQLKRDPHFAGYTWDMGQPHLLPNDLAQLQIEGTHAAAN